MPHHMCNDFDRMQKKQRTINSQIYLSMCHATTKTPLSKNMAYKWISLMSSLPLSLSLSFVQRAPLWCLSLHFHVSVSSFLSSSLQLRLSAAPRLQMRPSTPKRCVSTPEVWAERFFPKASLSERPRLRIRWRVWPTKTVEAQAFGTFLSKSPVRQHSQFQLINLFS